METTDISDSATENHAIDTVSTLTTALANSEALVTTEISPTPAMEDITDMTIGKTSDHIGETTHDMEEGTNIQIESVSTLSELSCMPISTPTAETSEIRLVTEESQSIGLDNAPINENVDSNVCIDAIHTQQPEPTCIQSNMDVNRSTSIVLESISSGSHQNPTAISVSSSRAELALSLIIDPERLENHALEADHAVYPSSAGHVSLQQDLPSDDIDRFKDVSERLSMVDSEQSTHAHTSHLTNVDPSTLEKTHSSLPHFISDRNSDPYDSTIENEGDSSGSAYLDDGDHDSLNGVDPHPLSSQDPPIKDNRIENPSIPSESPAIKSNLSQWVGKRYLGGFRHKTHGTEYFHAETQTPTPQERREKAAVKRFHQKSQTTINRNRDSQTSQDSSTQMTRPGYYVSLETATVLYSGTYITADERHVTQTNKAIIIQCFVRQTLARMRAQQLREDQDRRVKSIADKETRRIMLSEKKRRKDIESRLHPKTNKDIEILYNGLENWRLKEIERINGLGYSQPVRLAALADLLDQESTLLRKIDQLKVSVNAENHKRGITHLLEKMASPKRWVGFDGQTVLVDTPTTIRARKPRDLYYALNLPLLSVDERLQILLHVKYTVKEFDCRLSRDIVELIDREGDLVSRGRNVSSLQGLRQRISSLFLQFIRTPEFNPEAAAHQKHTNAGQSSHLNGESAVCYCRGCTKYKQSTEFYLSTTMKHLGKCKECTTKENIATQRKDDSIYSDMLKLVKAQEAARHHRSGMSTHTSYNAMTLLQESDMRYLVDVIWNHRSAVCGSHNMTELVLTRWDPALELSPWNSILLTKAEAATHDCRPDPHTMYSDDFISSVVQKHILAKQHFGDLPAMAKYLQNHYHENRHGKLIPKSVLKEDERVPCVTNHSLVQ
ncbi:hypothetical protein BASA50_003330 [Batrachochytrium salamandrivorans]|uniref:IQ motif and ubiquitin-like domain-containing protein n=1 Tax=Batrachochytrium salamandrivorans TaxID=1357716 RepID=A0ABQ8FJ43_9FUNG|nr:hypothetical protein BASA50_003330 [Batrachochytrium salamandrivorans]